MKKAVVILLSLLLTLPLASGFSASAEENLPEEIKILCIGNSFSCDTIEHVADIALSLGVKKVTLGNLYIGGCSVRKHYANAVGDKHDYEYFYNTGSGWSSTYNHSIKDTLQSEDWDYVSIQHGTLDGSRYAEEASYTDLPKLVEYVRSYLPEKTKIAFNMTWVGEPGSHEEMIAFGNDQLKYYNSVAALTSSLIAGMEGIDIISPTGTAVQNARTSSVGVLTRDNYHLSLKLGRYIAGLTFFKALTGADVSEITWAPDGVNAYMKAVALESVQNAIQTPYSVTASVIEKPEFVWPESEYGPAATPKDPFYAHGAKTAPEVEEKVDILPYFNINGVGEISTTIETANGLGLTLDLEKTPYLYYSFVIPKGSDFCFSIYSDSTYSPWLTFLDASKGDAVLNESAENWDAAFGSGRKQYATQSQTGCIDLRDYTVNGALKWVVSRMKLYAPKGDTVAVSYFFFGSEPLNDPAAEYSEEESVISEISENSAPVSSQVSDTTDASSPKNTKSPWIMVISGAVVGALVGAVSYRKARKK